MKKCHHPQFSHIGRCLIGSSFILLWLFFAVINIQAGSVQVDPYLKLELQSTNRQQGFSVRWPSDVGTIYQVQSSTRLSETIWTNLGMPFTAIEDTTSVQVGAPILTQQYYRVAKTGMVLFQDDFESRRLDQWTLLGTPWTIMEENSNSHCVSGRGPSAWLGPVFNHMWSDINMRLKLKILSGLMEINVRSGKVGKYAISFEAGKIHLNKVIWPNTFINDLVISKTPFASGQWHNIEIQLSGSYIKVIVDNESRINYQDPQSLAEGSVSFVSLAGSCLIDDVQVTGPPPLPPDLRFTWVRTGGPLGGIGYDIRIDPTNPDTLYVTDAFSGVSKSTDGGANWKPINKGIISRNGPSGDAISVFCLTIDPHNSQTLWAGTLSMRGVYKSTNGGALWQKRENGIPDLPGITFRSFTVQPGNSDIVYLGADIPTTNLGPDGTVEAKGKIFKTIDGGNNWTEILDCGALVRWVVIDPTDTQIIYAATGIFDRDDVKTEGILKTTDGGRTWRQINQGLGCLTVGGLVMDPRNTKVLYAATGRNVGFGGGPSDLLGGVYKSFDGGETWSKILDEGAYFFVVTAIGLDPSNPDIIYAAPEGTTSYRSEDGGKTWRAFSFYGDGTSLIGAPIAVTYHPTDARVLYINSYIGGVFKSTDGGATWNVASRGYTGAQISDVGIDPLNPATVYTAGRNGLSKSEDGGISWHYFTRIMGTNFFSESGGLSVHPTNANDVILGTRTGPVLVRTTDGGKSWTRVFNPEWNSWNGFVRFARCRANPKIIFTAGRSASGMSTSLGILKSVDGGEHWQPVNTGLITDLNMNAVAIHPDNAEIVYAGAVNGGIYRSTNGGAGWQAIGGKFAVDVRAIAIDPILPDRLYAGIEAGGMFVSTNGGFNWSRIGNGLESNASIRSIVIDPTNPDIVWAGDYLSGVYRSTDRGASWIPINDGLGNRAVTALSISANGKVLYAATDGAGVFCLGELPY